MRGRQAVALHVLPHRGGGAETYIDALERALGDDWRHERFALSAGRTPAAALRSLPRSYPALWRAAGRADAVHVHGDVAAVLTLPLLGRRPTLMTTHGLHFLRRSEGARGRCFGAALRAALGRCRRVLCTSQAERDELAVVAPGAPLVVVHNAAPPPAARPDRAAARADLGVAGDAVVAVFAGQLEERKRPLPAARAALAVGAPLVLLIAGDGPQAAELQALTDGERVRMLGQLADLGAPLAAADVYLATAEREGLSYALLEAMDAGLAVISSDTPGNSEAIGDAGIVVDTADEAALADALRALVGDAARRERLGAAARERARSEFSEERFAAAVREAYRAASA